jgi:hypothetical protein
MLFRTIALIATMFLGLSSAVAQQRATTSQLAPKLPACSQSMLVGTWQAVFNGGLGYGSNFVCPISISSSGTLTAGTCTFFSGATATQLPSGSLIIDRACHVTGFINYTYESNPIQLSVSLWRSADGSRLSGFSELCGVSCATNPEYAIPFEMILQ